MDVYQVSAWDANFENHKSRERENCRFVYVPNGLGGLSLRRLLAESDGWMIYGLFHLLLCKLSQQALPRDGWLTDDGHPTGTPWTPDDLVVLFGGQEAGAERALQVLSSPQVGWLTKHDSATVAASTGCVKSVRKPPDERPPSVQQAPLNGRERKGTVVEVNGRELNNGRCWKGKTAGASRPFFDEPKKSEQKTASESTPLNASSETEPTQTPPNHQSVASNAAPASASPGVHPDLNLFVQLLRSEFDDDAARRITKWVFEKGYPRTFIRQQWIRLFAMVLQASARAKDGRARDPVSWLIALWGKGVEPNDSAQKEARDSWEAEEQLEVPDEAPDWLKQAVAQLGAPPPAAPPRRSVADVKAALGV